MEQTSEIVLLGGKACLLRSLILVDMRDFIYLSALSIYMLVCKYCR